MIYNPKQLANQLKLIRTQRDLTQNDLAKKVGIKQSTLSSFETHPETTQLQTVFKIIQALEVDFELHKKQLSTVAVTDEEW
ncbi:type II toxin-antitoxin system antitoxin HipB [Vibrio sp. S11_S32]|uniref:type II toxin-antitoxin system antitoxin HipB n=1 Tax=Vibrio sp. S11_S32 TaxID=2720225 RepID=UPI001680CE5A|nr:type II toxin-antitoxin system antitoxin HipB [Vibrio sp. S11_S32]MBD1575918.1 type II toxin-antitoxin system antitoxin HipB [Vibrio sp. S11_S32]